MLNSKSSFVKQKRVSDINLKFLIFTLKQDYEQLTDHSLIASLLNEKFNVNITKEDVDAHYGFDDIKHEHFEDESRKQYYNF